MPFYRAWWGWRYVGADEQRRYWVRGREQLFGPEDLLVEPDLADLRTCIEAFRQVLARPPGGEPPLDSEGDPSDSTYARPHLDLDAIRVCSQMLSESRRRGRLPQLNEKCRGFLHPEERDAAGRARSVLYLSAAGLSNYRTLFEEAAHAHKRRLANGEVANYRCHWDIFRAFHHSAVFVRATPEDREFIERMIAWFPDRCRIRHGGYLDPPDDCGCTGFP
jgi:hypothetical protein